MQPYYKTTKYISSKLKNNLNFRYRNDIPLFVEIKLKGMFLSRQVQYDYLKHFQQRKQLTS